MLPLKANFDILVRIIDRLFAKIAGMKRFAELFKKYRLRAEFETFASFSDALADKGYYYEESIFSHWQKGTRVPTNRNLIVTIIEIFIEREAIKTENEANELLAATGLGYLTEREIKTICAKINWTSQSKKHKLFSIYNILLVLILLVVAVLTIYMHTQSQYKTNYVSTYSTVPSAVTEPKKLVIGIDATLRPMEYIEEGKLVGFDVDLGKHLAREMDADIEFRIIAFDTLFNSLDERKINMIISAVTMDDERQQKYNFSDPYLNAGQVILTKKENITIHKLSDLRDKKIATQTGTTNEKEALKYTSDKYVIRYTNFMEATEALRAGKVDALFTDLPNAKVLTSQNSDLKIVGGPFTDEYYGIVFIKGDPSVTQINETLTILRKKGILSDLEKKWLH